MFIDMSIIQHRDTNVKRFGKIGMMEFKDWLVGKFLEWEKQQEKRQPYVAFARFLGVKQSALSQWMNGNNTPTLDYVGVISDKLGPEIYDVLGLQRPTDLLDGFPPRIREALLSARETIISRGLSGDSPEAVAVITEAMRAAGYRLILTNDE